MRLHSRNQLPMLPRSAIIVMWPSVVLVLVWWRCYGGGVMVAVLWWWLYHPRLNKVSQGCGNYIRFFMQHFSLFLYSEDLNFFCSLSLVHNHNNNYHCRICNTFHWKFIKIRLNLYILDLGCIIFHLKIFRYDSKRKISLTVESSIFSHMSATARGLPDVSHLSATCQRLVSNITSKF